MTNDQDSVAMLLVEDNEEDVLLVKRAFAQNKIINPLQVVRNGHEAILYLQGGGQYRDRKKFPLPKLVLLDLRLPGIDGFEVLTWIRQRAEFRRLRVVVLTSSSAMKDVNRAYQLGANSFLMKPTDFDDLVSLTQALRGYWIALDRAAEECPNQEGRNTLG